MKGFAAFLIAVFFVDSHAATKCPANQVANQNDILAHEDCDKFYKCAQGVLYEQNCPAGLFFNTKVLVCDWRHNVDCGDRKVPGEEKPEPDPEPEPNPQPKPDPEYASTTEPDPESEDNEIDDKSDEESEIEFQENGCPVNPHIHWLFANAEDCNAFYQCVWGKPVPKRCAGSLHFNRILQVCDWPENAGCELPTSDPPTTATTPSPPSSPRPTPRPTPRPRHFYKTVVEVEAGIGLHARKRTNK